MKILVIDDEKSIRVSLEIGLKKLKAEILTAETGEEGLQLITKENPDLAIVDIKLPGIDGIEVLKQIKIISPQCTVVMITYLSEVRLAVRSMKMGAYDYFTKPFKLNELIDSIKQILVYIELKRKLDNDFYKNNIELIGDSKNIKKIQQTIMEVGKMEYDTFMLIEGESGTGKEVVARSIYNSLTHNDGAFIAINCAAIPNNLQESELFGFEKGAFSDANNTKLGLIEQANGGVLFLDEIADMDIGLQAKMLRVLQEKRFRRIGGLKEIEFNATIVTATNKNLEDEIKLGNFRQDLYYRLNIIPIYIAPLRERKEDIKLMFSYFINEYNKKLNKNILSINDNVINVLQEYTWPGNVRELKNVVERIMIFKKNNEITINDLPGEIFIEVNRKAETDVSKLQDAEKTVIEESLYKNNWNITKTANELKLSRITVRRKIEKYEIQRL